jgi:hypothetical protein
MWIIYGLAALALIGGGVHLHLSKRRKRKNKNAEPANLELGAIADLPVGEWAFVDECIPATTEGTEVNGGPDLLYTIAMEVSERGTKPAFIVVTVSEDGLDKRPTTKMIQLLALNIPVYQGHHEYRAIKSEGALAIIERSKQGPLDLVYGAAAHDLQWSLQNGAHANNITFYGLLRGTSNGKHMDGLEEAAEVVPRLLGESKMHEVTNYYYPHFSKNLPAGYKDTQAFIERNRGKLAAWDATFTAAIMARARALNAEQRLTNGSLRAGSDAQPQLLRLGYSDTNMGVMYSKVQHGIDILADRIARGAVETLVQTPATAPPKDKHLLKPASVDLSKAKVYKGSTNPLNFPETAIAANARVAKKRYWLTHSKEGVWKSKLFEHGKYIDGSDSIISMDPVSGELWICNWEYSVAGKKGRGKGWSYYPWIRKGHIIGILAATNTRNSKWSPRDNAGKITQRPERSNIVWVVAE